MELPYQYGPRVGINVIGFPETGCDEYGIASRLRNRNRHHSCSGISFIQFTEVAEQGDLLVLRKHRPTPDHARNIVPELE